jgi:sugar phosphate isomerase/epimerase
MQNETAHTKCDIIDGFSLKKFEISIPRTSFQIPMLCRRKFLQMTGTSLAASMAFDFISCSPATASRSWGVQLFTIPQMIARDFAGTLKKLAGFGYREIEFFGPYPFSAPATIEGWKPLAQQLGISQNAFYGYEVSEVKKMLDHNGLKSPSAHLDMATMRTNLSGALENLSVLDVRYVVIPALRGEPLDTLAGYQRLADEFNGFGKVMKEFGITFVFHNHGYEHAVKDGQVPLDFLISHTDPETVKFELDIFWMQAAGASPVDYLNRYPGRFKLMHVKDAAEPVHFSGDGSTPDQWMELFPRMADPGTGVFDIPGIISAAVKSGTEHFFLERDLTPTPDETLKNSIQYFSTLTV